MTKPTTTVEGAEAVAQIVALQAQRLVRIETSLRRIEAMIQNDRPIEPPREA